MSTQQGDDVPTEDESDRRLVLERAAAIAEAKVASDAVASDSIRTRAGSLITVATAVAAFLGGVGLDNTPSGGEWGLVIAAAVTYVLAAGLSLGVLMPREGHLELGWDTADVVDRAVRETDPWTYEHMLERLACNYQEFHAKNEKTLQDMAQQLQLAGGFLTLQVLLLLILIGVTAR